MRPAGLLAAAALLVGFGPGEEPFLGLRVGAPSADVDAALGGAGVRLTVNASGVQPGALRDGLVASGLLEAIHRADATPRSEEGGLDPAAFARVRVGATRQARYAVAESARGVGFVLVRVAVPVDPSRDPRGGWSKDRLHELQDALRAFAGYGLRPVGGDRYENHFEWRGKGRAGRVYVRYAPEDDEVVALLY